MPHFKFISKKAGNNFWMTLLIPRNHQKMSKIYENYFFLKNIVLLWVLVLTLSIYFRNLFYRTTYYLRHGIKLVFVEDGIAPEIKKSTLLQRNKGSNTSLERKGLQKISKQVSNVTQLQCMTTFIQQNIIIKNIMSI